MGVMLSTASAQFSDRLDLNLTGTYQSGVFDEGAAEIVAYDFKSKRLFTTNADANTVDIIDISDPANPMLITTIDLTSIGAGPNSVDVYSGDPSNSSIVAVAVEADPSTDPGTVAFYDTTGTLLSSVTVGNLPDMLTFTSDGSKLLVANEGEPSEDYTIDPEGSISIIDLTGGVSGLTNSDVTTASFTGFNNSKNQLVNDGVRIFGGVTTLEDIAGFDANSGEVTFNSSVDASYENLFATLEVSEDGEDDSELFRVESVNETNNSVVFADFDDDITAIASVSFHTVQSTVAQDVEPEYIALNGDDSKAWVTLQENNAVAIVDVATATVESIVPLGTKDHSQTGFGFDGSDDDDGINIETWPTNGMYQPDAIASYTINNTTYFVTANEGDAREYDRFLEELDLEDQILDENTFSNADELQSDDKIGPLTTTVANGDTDQDGDLDEIFQFGGRSFTIWDESGNIVFDSGDELAKITAGQLGPDGFNNDNDEQDPDSRSDNKGAEPEAVNVASINGQFYAFVGLERTGGVAVYNVTDPANAEFVTYINSRNLDIDFDEPDAATLEQITELGPEDIKFIPASQSPNGKYLIVVPQEVSGSISIYEVAEQRIPVGEARAASDGTNVTVEGIVTRVQGDFTYIQDNTGGLTIRATSGAYFDAVANGEIRSGDRIRFTGEMDTFSGLRQINDNGVVFEKLSTDNVLPEPNILTLAELEANGEEYEAQLVRVNDVTFSTSDDLFEAGTSYDITDASSSTNEVEFRVPNDADTDVNGTSIPVTTDFVGVLGQFNNFGAQDDNFGYQLLAVDSTDLQDTFSLALFHNNDGESELIDAGTGLENFGGVARFKTLFDTLKKDAFEKGQGVMMLSSGDNFLVGPEFSAGLEAGIFYDARAISLIGYDALAIGNHEFDLGPETFADFVASFQTNGVKTEGNTGQLPQFQAANPGEAPAFLSANLDFSGESSFDPLLQDGLIAKSKVVSVNGEQIGIIGATTPALRSVSAPGDVQIIDDLAGVVQSEIDALSGNGINKIVFISQLQSIREDSLLAQEVSGLDIMVSGGGQELLANSDDLLIPGDESNVFSEYPYIVQDANQEDVVVVTTTGEYRYLGQLVVDFDENGEITNISDESGPKRVSGTGADAVAENQAMLDQVVKPVEEFVSGLDQNIIANSEVVLDGRRSQLRTRETNEGNLVADALLWQAEQAAGEFGVDQPQIALQNGGGVRNDSEIPTGDISELETFNILPFTNFVTVVEDVPATQLKEILENAVSRVEFTDGRFAQVSGLRFAYDLNLEPRTLDDNGNVVQEGNRVISAILDDGTEIIQNGEVVDEEMTIDIATIDFLARGGDDYPFGNAEFTLLGRTYQQALFNYITDELNGEITADAYPEGGEGRVLAFEKLDIVEARSPERADSAVAFQGTVTRTGSRIFFVQDETAGIGVFQSSGPVNDALANGEIREGDLVEIWADRADFNGLQEVGNEFFLYNVLSRNKPIPNAQITTLDVIANEGEQFESEVVAVRNLTIDADGDTEFQPSKSYTVTDPDGNTLTLRTPSGSENAAIAGTPIPDGEFTFRGLVGEFNGTYQLSPWRASDVSASGFRLTILHNNDGESQLINAGSGLEDFGGVARFKTLVDSLRFQGNQDGGAVMLSSGDNFLAGPEFNVSLNNDTFFDARAIQLIDYDALALGNHDFDFGPDLLGDFISQVVGKEEIQAKSGQQQDRLAEIGEPPVFLSANLDFSNEAKLNDLVNSGDIAKSSTITVNGDIVGVIGATTPNLSFISSPGNVGIDADVANAVQAEIDALENNGVNKIILISHLQGIAEDSTLATQLSGVDIMIAGGGDELLADEDDLLIPGDEEDVSGSYPMLVQNNDGDQIPIVTSAGNYKYVGRLVVEFDDSGKVSLIDDPLSGPIRVAGGDLPDAVDPDPQMLEDVTNQVAAGVEALAENVIATSEVTLDGERNDVRSRETNEGNLIADAFRWQANQLAADFGVPVAEISVANGGGIRNDNELPAGPISELNTFDMAPFGNIMSIVEGLEPDRFKLMMENSVSRIQLNSQDEPEPVGSGTGRFAQISGFSVEYNPDNQPLVLDGDGNVETPGSRIISIVLDDGTVVVENGEVVSGAPTVNVATGDFTARGGDQFPFDGLNFTLLGVTDQQSILNYMSGAEADGALGGTVTAEQYPVGGEGRITITDEGLVSTDDSFTELPSEFQLKQNFPNPFNPSTQIEYALPEAARVTLTVYNALGQQVAQLVNTRQSAGQHAVSFDASSLSSGMYLYRIRAGNFIETRKMMLVK